MCSIEKQQWNEFKFRFLEAAGLHLTARSPLSRSSNSGHVLLKRFWNNLGMRSFSLQT